MDPSSGLIVIDMQNEFLSDTGSYSKNHVPNDVLVSNVRSLIRMFTSRDRPVIFIRAEYDSFTTEVRRPDKFTIGTHCGANACCAPGSDEAKIHPGISELITRSARSSSPNGEVISNHPVITKRWFSAFKETNLKQVLENLGLKKIYFAGLKTNVCVYLSLIESLQYGYAAVIVSDCCAATNIDKHNRALLLIQEAGGQVCVTNDLFGESQ